MVMQCDRRGSAGCHGSRDEWSTETAETGADFTQER